MTERKEYQSSLSLARAVRSGAERSGAVRLTGWLAVDSYSINYLNIKFNSLTSHLSSSLQTNPSGFLVKGVTRSKLNSICSRSILECSYEAAVLNERGGGKMPGPVERWLETFMCKQYAYVFEEYGFKTLQQVCQLQSSTLHSMGIPPDHCDKIVENVSVLRQSLVASSPEHMGSHETNFPPPSSYGGRHNPQSHPYSAGSGCNYPEIPYDNQMVTNIKRKEKK
uniref:SAM domain-containing protein n=1 Tax=Strigamia maritima TaxID=126957 RepID=T1J1V0_STRMM